jgi:DNA repair ATPase RecN
MAEIRVLKTVISNVGGIDHLEIDHTSPVIIVTGGNGVGKTSIKQAYELLFDGGHRPDYIKCGQKKAEVLITLSDGITIRRVQTHKTAEYTVTSRDGAIGREAAGRVRSATRLRAEPESASAARPSNKKKRLQLLQEIMPINFTKPEIDQACGFDSFLATPEIDLEKFDALLAGQELARRDANTAVREHEGTWSQLKQQLPPDADQQKDWKSEAEAKHLQKERVAAEINRIETRGQLAIESRLEELRQEQDAKIEAIRKHYGAGDA